MKPSEPAPREPLEKLRRRREQLGLSQRAVAAMIGECQSWVSRFEANKFSRLALSDLLRVARALKYTPVIEFKEEEPPDDT